MGLHDRRIRRLGHVGGKPRLVGARTEFRLGRGCLSLSTAPRRTASLPWLELKRRFEEKVYRPPSGKDDQAPARKPSAQSRSVIIFVFFLNLIIATERFTRANLSLVRASARPRVRGPRPNPPRRRPRLGRVPPHSRSRRARRARACERRTP